MLQVSIIILNYNTFQLTCNCIESVIKYTQDTFYEIILVDNQSTECDADLFKQNFPSINLIKSPINGGFAKGNNLGIEQAKGEFILLLNSDTYLLEDSISKTLQYYKHNNYNGVTGCKMTFDDGRIQHTARKFRSITWEILDSFRFIPFLFPYKKRAELMLGKYFKSDHNLECDWLNGAFFMFPKIILNKLPQNKLDDRFFMYGEDQLWSYQFKQLGYKNYFYSETQIIHINNGSTKKEKRLSLRKLMLKQELEIYKIINGNGIDFFLFKIIYTIKEKVRIFIIK